MGIEARLPDGILLTTVEKVVQWGRAGSMFPATFGLACCAIEMMSTGAAHYDLARFGMEVWRGSPRQADLMIIAGRVSQKMAPVIRNLYDQMPDPKWVIAMGVCSSSGGMYDSYSVVQGVDSILPVDIYVPDFATNTFLLAGTGTTVLKFFLYISRDEQKERLLPRMATGEIRAAFSLSEPELGSDVQAIKTSAVKSG